MLFLFVDFFVGLFKHSPGHRRGGLANYPII
jgi:hypothetical protein